MEQDQAEKTIPIVVKFNMKESELRRITPRGARATREQFKTWLAKLVSRELAAKSKDSALTAMEPSQ